MALQFTPVDEIPAIHQSLRDGFATGKTKDINYRKTQLLNLAYLLQENNQRFKEAIAADLGRPHLECDFLELNPCLSEIYTAFKSVEKWSKPEKPPFSLQWSAMKPVIRKEPKGVILIISPFNFPVTLSLGPLAGAIAAGNAVLLKPSELTPATSSLFAELVPKYLDSDLVRVVNGAVAETTKILELQWDHILYTGSGRVAKIVSTAAAKFLTPVTLELGGKNPVFIDPKSDLKLAARRVLWGKSANAGQVCIAPDYVLVPRAIQNEFVDELQKAHKQFYPSGAVQSDSFSRIVSTSHATRIKKLLDDTQGKVVAGGEIDIDKRFIAPTVVRDVPLDDSLMSDEIFGPVLPVVPVESVDEAVKVANSKDHPLTLYVFSQDNEFKQQVFDNTQSGAAIANDVIIHYGTEGLPFGGIGPSGSGYTTGKFAFDAFTHLRASIDSPGWIDKYILGGRFPPYTPEKFKTLQKMSAVKLPPRNSVGRSTSNRWILWLLGRK